MFAPGAMRLSRMLHSSERAITRFARSSVLVMEAWRRGDDSLKKTWNPAPCTWMMVRAPSIRAIRAMNDFLEKLAWDAM